MKVLLDTHCWLWWITEPERLNENAKGLISHPANEIYFSSASAWEIAIKYRLGKLPLPESPDLYVPRMLAHDEIQALTVELRHALHVAALPLHHRDPFDRMLVAQAQLEKMSLVTADPQFERYEVAIIRAEQ